MSMRDEAQPSGWIFFSRRDHKDRFYELKFPLFYLYIVESREYNIVFLNTLLAKKLCDSSF